MEKLNEIIKHAYSTVQLYQRIAEEKHINIKDVDIRDLPIVDKNMYLDCGMSVISSEYIGKYFQNKLIWSRTSGSTGKYGEVYWDEIEMRKSLFSLWCYRKKYYNILPSDKLCYFFSADVGEGDIYEKGAIKAFSKKCLYDGTLSEVYKKILLFNPVWMLLQPSVAVLLCNLIEENSFSIPSSLRYIEFTGEYLENSVRERVYSIFKCIIANQYGTKEVNSIAFECPQGNLHCMSDNVYIEELDKGNGIKSLCVTTLQNRAMPLIRFDLGDRGRLLTSQKCSCGNHNNILVLEAGRNNDWIKLEDGTKIHSYAMIQIINAINYEIAGGIIQYQIVQKNYNYFTVFLVLEESGDKDSIVVTMVERLQSRFGENIKFIIKILEEVLPDANTGKLACFICEV